MLSELGFPYLWICVGNCVVVLVLQYVIAAPRPIDYAKELYIYKCTDPDTMGFPAIDSHMAIVVVVPAILSSSSATTIMVWKYAYLR